MKDGLVILAVLMIAAFVFAGLFVELQNCNGLGGTLVRGLVWMECINTETGS